MKEQSALEIARRMVELDQQKHAVTAYTLALGEVRGKDPDVELEAALYLLQHGGNYKVAYDVFLSLYQRGFRTEESLFVGVENRH